MHKVEARGNILIDRIHEEKGNGGDESRVLERQRILVRTDQLELKNRGLARDHDRERRGDEGLRKHFIINNSRIIHLACELPVNS